MSQDLQQLERSKHLLELELMNLINEDLQDQEEPASVDPSPTPSEDAPSITDEGPITLSEPEKKPGFTDHLIDAGRGALHGVLAAGEAIGGLLGGIYAVSPIGVAESLAKGRNPYEYADQVMKSRAGHEIVEQFEPETLTGQLVSPVAQLFIPMLVGAGVVGAVSKASKAADGVKKAATLGQVVKDGALGGSLTETAVFQGFEDNLANFLERDLKLKNAALDFFADKENDPEIVARLKNTLTGSIIGGFLGPAIHYGGKAAIKTGKVIVDKSGQKILQASVNNAPQSLADNLLPVFEHIKNFRRIKSEQGEKAAAEYVSEHADDIKGILNDLGFDRRSPRARDLIQQEIDQQRQYIDQFGSTPEAELKLDKLTQEYNGVHPEQQEKASAFAEELVRRVNAGEPLDDLDVRGLINPDTFNNPEELTQTVQALMYTIKEGLYRKKTVTFEQMRENAASTFDQIVSNIADLGADKDGLAYLLAKDAANIEEATVNAIITKNVLSSLSRQAVDLAKNAIGDVSGDSVLKIHNIRETIQTLINPYAKVRSGAGRMLGAFRIKDNFANDVTDLIKDQPEGFVAGSKAATKPKTLEEAALQHLSDVEAEDLAVIHALQQASNDYARQRLLTLATDLPIKAIINGMLSSPVTHAVNMTSNTLKLLSMPFEEVLGSAMPSLWDQSPTIARNAAMTYAGYWKFFADAARMASRAWIDGEPILTKKAGIDLLVERDIDMLRQTVDKDGMVAAMMNFLESGLDAVDNIPVLGKISQAVVRPAVEDPIGLATRALNAEDEFFKQLAYRSRVYAFFFGQGMDAGLKGKALSEYVERNFNEAFDALGRGTNSEALEFAGRATFTQDLNDSNMLGAVGNWIDFARQHDNKMLSVISRLLFPFVRTPFNIIQDVIEHTPGLGQLPGLSSSWLEDFAAGGARKSQAVGKLMFGSMLWTMASMAAANGLITGAGPSDPRQRKQLWDTGWRPYSLLQYNEQGKIVGAFSLSRLDPWGSILGLAADGSETVHALSEEEWEEATKKAITALTNNLSSKKYLKGAISLMGVLGGQSHGDPVEPFIQNIASMAVPNFLQLFNTDPHLREVRGVFDTVRRKIPGHSETLPPSRDPFGRILQSGILGIYSPINDDPLTQEVIRLTTLGGQISYMNKGIGRVNFLEFTDSEGRTAYDRLGELLEAEPVGGKTLVESVTQLIQSKDYQEQLDDPFKRNSHTYKGGKVEAINDRILKYRHHLMMNRLLNEPFYDKQGQSLKSAIIADKTFSRALTQEGLQAADDMMAPADDGDMGLDPAIDALQPFMDLQPE